MQSQGTTYEVRFAPVDDNALLARIDGAYSRNFDGSAYLPATLAAGPRACTLVVTPAA